MNIKIVSVGKIKEKYLKLGIDEFSKRLSKYCKLEIVELSDEKAPENLSKKEIEIIKEKEGKKILSHIKDNTYAIALAIEGKNLSSEELADKLNNLSIMGRSNITFVIGGSLGLSKEVLDRADFKLSFSKMTFPHQLMRLILLEQVYRSFRIIKGEPYHK
ncbi:23S rRNA (pseudouridine(1915)-N(3))-methyltransferase RlmH [Tepidibacter formicigenes]|jgi:23S rRNA (pseudouridine1915-N3)-methyltransferase|uniref:Ribosomal RNA large subunit methyltransferase H n=1 Tax=Tepidibacter formicigenes DSM 15518 TaxID=1123349 RepID=A0A1M6NK98_9FIRM|nr:23S rRNA (pseudouridine(1915)-N(3))-methyltransferase RlmH [Tepidibacter formicigenes]SHJ95952.1 23S rRNA (pseudouridine1915-N3)-methyltransferase [Tepidibacter formicigenes DSM 15518]